MDYILGLLIIISIYIILAVSLDLLVGYTGLLSLAQAAFYGIGAYTAALLAVQAGVPFLLSIPLAMTVAAIISLTVSLPSFRLHEDYFVISTFGFQIILFNVLNNWESLTRGAKGVKGIPFPNIFGFSVESRLEYAIVAYVCALSTYLIVRRISTSPFGRVLKAIRDDELLAQALGKNTLRFKVLAFAISSALAALAGGLYAHHIRYIDPTSFSIMESILIISMVIIGGAGSLYGPVIGALVLVTLPELLVIFDLPDNVAANVRQIVYGLSLVGVILFRPSGIAGRYQVGR